MPIFHCFHTLSLELTLNLCCQLRSFSSAEDTRTEDGGVADDDANDHRAVQHVLAPCIKRRLLTI